MSQKRLRDPESAGCGYGSEALVRVWSIIFLVYLTLLIMAPVRGRLTARFYIKPAALIKMDRLQIQVFKGFLSTFRTCVFLIIGKAVKEQASKALTVRL